MSDIFPLYHTIWLIGKINQVSQRIRADENFQIVHYSGSERMRWMIVLYTRLVRTCTYFEIQPAFFMLNGKCETIAHAVRDSFNYCRQIDHCFYLPSTYHYLNHLSLKEAFYYNDIEFILTIKSLISDNVCSHWFRFSFFLLKFQLL